MLAYCEVCIVKHPNWPAFKAALEKIEILGPPLDLSEGAEDDTTDGFIEAVFEEEEKPN
jgi:hypothetical protein